MYIWSAMRKWPTTAALVAFTVVLSACGTAGGPDTPPATQSPGPGDTSPAPSESPGDLPDESPTPSPSETATESATADPSPTESPSATGSPTPLPDATPSGTMDARLKIDLTADGADYRFTYTLNCLGVRPLDSTFHPNADMACRVLTLRGEKILFAAPDPTRACTQQYGGPQRAQVSGTLNGRPVDESFSKRDGCEIHRWLALEALFRSSQNP